MNRSLSSDRLYSVLTTHPHILVEQVLWGQKTCPPDLNLHHMEPLVPSLHHVEPFVPGLLETNRSIQSPFLIRPLVK